MQDGLLQPVELLAIRDFLAYSARLKILEILEITEDVKILEMEQVNMLHYKIVKLFLIVIQTYNKEVFQILFQLMILLNLYQGFMEDQIQIIKDVKKEYAVEQDILKVLIHLILLYLLHVNVINMVLVILELQQIAIILLYLLVILIIYKNFHKNIWFSKNRFVHIHKFKINYIN